MVKEVSGRKFKVLESSQLKTESFQNTKATPEMSEFITTQPSMSELTTSTEQTAFSYSFAMDQIVFPEDNKATELEDCKLIIQELRNELTELQFKYSQTANSVRELEGECDRLTSQLTE